MKNMMRLEETLSQALERVNNDRYRLSVAVGQRADELSKGAKPLIDISLTKNMKYTDIAIEEIATGALIIESIE
jgi:DNA-directed RNA polymerase subunit omega